ncbi:MAG: sulfatase, partial [Theionarchaea archaeon]|nr:sulfatase [Theionarchaea archaeon]
MKSTPTDHSCNVILITIDCLRADHLHCYGYFRDTTPFIDSMARKGITFRNCFANGPFTASAFPAILTSTYALDNGRDMTLRNRTFVSEILQKEDIRTAAIHSNPYLSSQAGYNRGFDYFEDFLNQKVLSKRGTSSRKGLKLLQRMDEVTKGLNTKFVREPASLIKNYLVPREEPFVPAEVITEMGAKWINNSPDPFFLWVHYMDLHEPYIILNTHVDQMYSRHVSRLLQSALLRVKQKHIQHIIDIYDDKLRYIDYQVQRLCSLLKNCPDSVVIITSDHGQEFYEHGNFGHRAQYYDEILHVPLIIHGSEKMQRDDMRSQLDISPTILSCFGIDSPPNYCGSSLFSGSPTDFVISESSHNEEGLYLVDPAPTCVSHAVRTKTFKYIQQYQEELYNVQKD